MRRSHAAIAVVVMIATAALQAQDAQPRVAFEVATIKRNVSLGSGGSMGLDPGGRFHAVNAPLLWLMASAYAEPQGPLRPSQIVGAPSWLNSEHYDINAKTADAVEMTFDQSRFALRLLIEDRFKLRVHREQRQMTVYALVRVRSDGSLGPRLRQSTPDCLKESAKCGFAGGPIGRIKAGAITMDLLRQVLAGATDRIVIDRTGLQGGFDIDLEWSPDQTATDKPSIFTAVQEQLGLKLDSTKAPVEVVVIDHVERPTED